MPRILDELIQVIGDDGQHELERFELLRPPACHAALQGAMIRELCGEVVFDAVGLEKSDWSQHLLGPIRLAFNLADEAQDHSSLAAKSSGSFSRKPIEGLHASERGGKRVMFRIPQSLQDALGVNTPEAKSA